ncbi:hypothetical protein [Bacillus sp. FJAT-26390]|uniref:hypothetical protein n=1 Tax=Bacillus sp. FJAT-26390 TaxID=1743142 RepID=UPI000807F323|nr:hypothetical protein [Bacillus sp. FJAT-26390]OBZ12284.1 hypothetical protein A7975_14705 [Bacillus sp. FJAT-26390]
MAKNKKSKQKQKVRAIQSDANLSDGNRMINERTSGNRSEGLLSDGNRTVGNRTEGSLTGGNRTSGIRTEGSRPGSNSVTDGNRSNRDVPFFQFDGDVVPASFVWEINI